MVILSASAFANTPLIGNYSQRSGNKVIHTQAMTTKAAAYSVALQKLNELTSESARELSYDLVAPVDTYKERNSVEIDNAYVQAQEFMNKEGQILYDGAVHITYHYAEANDH